MAEYSIFLVDVNGERIASLGHITSLAVALALNTVGVAEIVLPASAFDWRAIKPDMALEIWRTPDVARRLGWFFIRRIVRRISGQGNEELVLRGVTPLDLLRRRIVYAPAGSSGASKTGPADDVIKALVRENLGAAAAAERQVPGLTVQADRSEAPSISKSFAYRNVLTVCQEIAEQSTALGVPLFFDLERKGDGTFEFLTAAWGADHRATSPFSVQRGTLDAPITLALDHSEEINYVYAGGRGEGSDREIAEAYDEAALAVSPFNRCEGFKDGRSTASLADLEGEAEEYIWQNRRRREFSARLVDVPDAQYQIDWALGDWVLAEYDAEKFECLVEAVIIRLTSTEEKIEAKLSHVD